MIKLPRLVMDGMEPFAAWGKALGATLGMRGVPPVKVSDTAAGRVVSLGNAGERFVRLSGSSSPYTGTQVYDKPMGDWDDLAGMPALENCYESNSVSGLSGKVVKIRPGTSNDWRFEFNRRGARMHVGCELCVTVSGCSGHVNGATVHVTGPDDYDETCVTDSSGKCCVEGLTDGATYTVAVSKTGFTTNSQSLVMHCTTNCFCACGNWPATIDLVVTNPDMTTDPGFQSCTLHYQAAAATAGQPGYGKGPNIWVSDPIAVSTMSVIGTAWQVMYCQGGQFFCQEYDDFNTIPPGTIVIKGNQYRWTLTDPGNTCNPFNAPNGFRIGASLGTTAAISGDTSVAGLTCPPTALSVSLALATGYSCSKDPCCPAAFQSGPPYTILSYPNTLYLNDGQGMVTLTRSGSVWRGSSTRNASATTRITGGVCDYNGPSGSVPVEFSFECNVDGGWSCGIGLYAMRHPSGASCPGNCSASLMPPSAVLDLLFGYSFDFFGIGHALLTSCPPSLAWTSHPFNFSYTDPACPGFHPAWWYIYGNSTTVSITQ